MKRSWSVFGIFIICTASIVVLVGCETQKEIPVSDYTELSHFVGRPVGELIDYLAPQTKKTYFIQEPPFSIAGYAVVLKDGTLVHAYVQDFRHIAYTYDTTLSWSLDDLRKETITFIRVNSPEKGILEYPSK